MPSLKILLAAVLVIASSSAVDLYHDEQAYYPEMSAEGKGELLRGAVGVDVSRTSVLEELDGNDLLPFEETGNQRALKGSKARPRPAPAPTPPPTDAPTKAPKASKIATPASAVKATKAPGATKAPKATKAPGATKAPKTTKAPGATKAPKATKAPGATKAPKGTKTIIL
jgi:hypothetical protein